MTIIETAHKNWEQLVEALDDCIDLADKRVEQFATDLARNPDSKPAMTGLQMWAADLARLTRARQMLKEIVDG